MRREQDIVETEQGIGRVERLALEHIERGAADPPFPQRGHERLLIDDGAARDVDQERVALHQADALAVDEPRRLRRQRTAQDHDIAFGHQHVEVERRHALRQGSGGARGGGDRHRETELRDAVNGAADIAHADDAHAQARKLACLVRMGASSRPAGAAQIPVDAAKAAQQGERGEDRIFRDGLGVDGGHVGDQHAGRSRRLHRDHVEPRSMPDRGAQPRRAGKEFRRNGRAHDQDVGIEAFCQKGVRGRCAGNHERARRFHQGRRRRMDRMCREDQGPAVGGRHGGGSQAFSSAASSPVSPGAPIRPFQ